MGSISKTDGIVTGVRTEGKEKIITIAPTLGSKHATKKNDPIEYSVHFRRVVLVHEGESVKQGQLLTDGLLLISSSMRGRYLHRSTSSMKLIRFMSSRV